MKSVPKLIRRFVGIMLLSSVLLIILNLALLVIYTLNQAPNSSPWMTAQKVADNLLQDGNESVLWEDYKIDFFAFLGVVFVPLRKILSFQG